MSVLDILMFYHLFLPIKYKPYACLLFYCLDNCLMDIVQAHKARVHWLKEWMFYFHILLKSSRLPRVYRIQRKQQEMQSRWFCIKRENVLCRRSLCDESCSLCARTSTAFQIASLDSQTNCLPVYIIWTDSKIFETWWNALLEKQYNC